MADRIEDKLEIMELKYQYCYATDALDADWLVDAFAPDGSFEIGFYGSVTGHDEIRDYIDWFGDREYEVRSHNVFNPLITVDGDTAEGRWYYVVMYELPDGTVELAQGQYHDEYVAIDGEWKISSVEAERRITTEIQRPDSS